MNGAVEIEDGWSSEAAMASVAAIEFKLIPLNGLVTILLDGEPDFIGSAGEGDTIDFVLDHYGLESTPSEGNIWEYYKSKILNRSGSFMKAWLHWNGKSFDAYLKCGQDSKGNSGFASHAMPYIQQ